MQWIYSVELFWEDSQAIKVSFSDWEIQILKSWLSNMNSGRRYQHHMWQLFSIHTYTIVHTYKLMPQINWVKIFGILTELPETTRYTEPTDPNYSSISTVPNEPTEATPRCTLSLQSPLTLNSPLCLLILISTLTPISQLGPLSPPRTNPLRLLTLLSPLSPLNPLSPRAHWAYWA